GGLRWAMLRGLLQRPGPPGPRSLHRAERMRNVLGQISNQRHSEQPPVHAAVKGGQRIFMVFPETVRANAQNVVRQHAIIFPTSLLVPLLIFGTVQKNRPVFEQYHKLAKRDAAEVVGKGRIRLLARATEA